MHRAHSLSPAPELLLSTKRISSPSICISLSSFFQGLSLCWHFVNLKYEAELFIWNLSLLESAGSHFLWNQEWIWKEFLLMTAQRVLPLRLIWLKVLIKTWILKRVWCKRIIHPAVMLWGRYQWMTSTVQRLAYPRDALIFSSQAT